MYCMEQVSPLKMRCIRRVSNLQLPSVRVVQASEKKKEHPFVWCALVILLLLWELIRDD